MTVLTQILNGSNYGDARTTLNLILKLRFDVKLYGAVGDGTTDDTTAIDAAVSALATAGGGILFFPPGSYLYTHPRIRITTSNTWLEGAGATLLFNCVTYSGSTAEWAGRILFDGGFSSGEIVNVGIRGQGLTIKETSGHDFSGDTMNDPLGNLPYSSMVCSVMMRGCGDFLIDGGYYLAAPGWSIHGVRCRDGSIINTTVRDAIADGIHLDYGCTRIAVFGNHLYNLGDDAVAVGYTGAACSNIYIGPNFIHDVGGKGVAIYGGQTGTTDEITVDGVDIDNTFASGIGIVALAYSGSGSSSISGPIGTVRLTDFVMRNAGMRSTSAFSRAVGESHGVSIEPSGSTIGQVVINGAHINKNRNTFVYVHGTGLASLIVRGMDCGTQSATGAGGAATSGGGSNTTPTSTAPLNITAAGIIETFGMTVAGSRIADTDSTAGGSTIAGDTFARANVSPGATALGTTETGSKAWNTASTGFGISSNKAYSTASVSYPTAILNSGVVDTDMSVDVTVGGAPCYMFISTNSTAQTGIVFSSSGTGNLYADGASPATAATTTGQFTSGTQTMRLKVKGLAVSAYIGGALVGTLTLPSGFQKTATYVGFGVFGTSDGTERFDNFTVSAAT